MTEMINAFDIFENITDYEKELFITAFDKRLAKIPELYDNAKDRVSRRENVMTLKEKFNAGVYGFTYKQLVHCRNIFVYYFHSEEVLYSDEDTQKKLLATCNKYSELMDNLINQHQE